MRLGDGGDNFDDRTGQSGFGLGGGGGNALGCLLPLIASRFGIVFVDYATQKRVPKASFDWFAELIRAQQK